MGIPAGSYVHVCILKGKVHRGEVKQKQKMRNRLTVLEKQEEINNHIYFLSVDVIVVTLQLQINTGSQNLVVIVI